MAEVMDPNVSVEEEPLTQVPESDQSDDEPQDEPEVVTTVEGADDESVTPESVPLVNGQTGEENSQTAADVVETHNDQDNAATVPAPPTENAPPEVEENGPPQPLVQSEDEGCRKRKASTNNNPDDEAKKAKSEEEEAKKTNHDDDEDDDDGASCPICFEPWTNSGDHRIASLKCGHFFGKACIERWLKTSGDDCPNCNEKATRRDVRLHYVARLKAVDTAEKDRAVGDLEKFKCQLRTLELDHTTLKVTNAMQREEIDKLRRQLRQICPDPSRLALLDPDSSSSQPSTSGTGGSGSTSGSYSRLNYVKRMELMKFDGEHRERYCRVMAYNQTHGMLAVSQPSFTALAPGYGVRRLSILDLRVEKFICLHKEPIRDMAFNPVSQDQLLSVSQDKSARLTNISSCGEIQRYFVGADVWSCCWHLDQPTAFFVGTKTSQILMFDTRDPGTEPRTQLQFPNNERRPIIGLAYVPAANRHPTFPCGGLLVQTLGSLWFFENKGQEFYAHKLEVSGLFWCLRFDVNSRLILASTKPSPHARHIVAEPIRVNVAADPTAGPDFKVSVNIILDNRAGGSYTDRSFLRTAIFSKPQSDTMLVAYSRGSVQSDHKLIIQEVGMERFVQDIPVPKPVLDICPVTLNQNHYVILLTETEVFIYQWT